MPKLTLVVTIMALAVGFSIPNTEVACDILATAVEMLVCATLVAIGVLGLLNVACRWKLKKEGISDEYMDDIQRLMLGYVVKNRKDVNELRWWGQVFWGGKVVKGPSHAAPEPQAPSSANVVDLNEWRDRRLEHLEAAE